MRSHPRRNTTENQTNQIKRFYVQTVATDLEAISIIPFIPSNVVRNQLKSCVPIVGKNLQGIFPTTNTGVLRLHVKYVVQKSFFSYCYQIHLKTHEPRELKKCPICGKEGLIDLKIHIRRHKYDGLRGKCNLCNREMTQYSLKKHMKNVHEERKYWCFQCEYKATSKYNLNLHITKMHQVVELRNS